MRDAARIEAAIELVAEVARRARPADRTIAAYFRQRRYAGAKDRRAVTERVYRILRRWQTLSHAAGVASGGAPARDLVIVDLVLSDGAGPGRLDALFDGGRHGPRPLTAEERRRALRVVLPEDAPDFVRHEYPEWLDAALKRRFGVRLGAEMAALNVPAPLDVRVNTLKANREAVHSALAAAGIAAEPTPLSPVGLRLPNRVPFVQIAVWRSGLAEIQDEAAQLSALLAGAEAGMTVVDLCAGAGGKTLALAAEMQNRGRIVACDVACARLRPMAPRLRRAGVRIVETHLLAGDGGPPAGFADRVFVDAPCSGSGTWRRNPDAKLRLDPATLTEATEAQDRILANAAALTRPGGRLVYATCSVLEAENQIRVEKFLLARKDYKLIPMERVWRETVGGTPPAAGRWLELSPGTSGTDGFFVAVLERAR